MKNLALHWKIIIGLILGVIWAFISASFNWSEFTLDWINPFGTIFIRLLKMIAVPLVLFSIIKGVSGLTDVTKLGRLSIKTISAYLVTTVFAISAGLLLANIIQPGTFASDEQRIMNRKSYEKFVYENEGVAFKDDTRLLNKSDIAKITNLDVSELHSKLAAAEQQKNKGPLTFLVDFVPANFFHSLSDKDGKSIMLQVIFFALFFGIVLLFIDPVKSQPVITFVDGVNEVFMKMVDVIMQASPFFVFALMAGKVTEITGGKPDGIIQIFKGLSVYSLVVALGLATMVFVIYPSLVKLITRNRINFRNFFRSIGPAQLLAFTTSSSAATLPVTLDCVRENLKVSKDVTNFVLPIGATVNMDGTSLYQAVAVLFLAQFHMVDLSLMDQIMIVLTATMASIGAAAVPGAGLITLILVLESVGLDPAWVAIILPVDRILDMCRTVVNVTGDASVATIIATTENELHFDPETDFENFTVS